MPPAPIHVAPVPVSGQGAGEAAGEAAGDMAGEVAGEVAVGAFLAGEWPWCAIF